MTDQQEDQDRGLRCLDCGCRHMPVYKTIPVRGNKHRRERRCRNCGKLNVSYETVSSVKREKTKTPLV